MRTWTDPEATPDELEDVGEILCLRWGQQGMTFDQIQRHTERRRQRSEAALAREGKVRCKCGTEAMLEPGKGPHAAKAICPACDRRWWIKKEQRLEAR